MKRFLLLLLLLVGCNRQSGLSVQFHNDGVGPVNIRWTMPQNLATSSSSLTFGNVPVGRSSAPLVLVLSSDTELQLTGMALSGANPKDFSFVSNCVIDVLPTKGCNITVVFAPSVSGARSANLVIGFAGAPNSPNNLNVTVQAGNSKQKRVDEQVL